MKSLILALTLGAFACAAQTKGTQQPVPADPNAPGAQHPMPIPRQTPKPVPPDIRTPDVRNPATDSTRKKGRRTAPKAKGQTTSPAGESPKAKTEARPQP